MLFPDFLVRYGFYFRKTYKTIKSGTTPEGYFQTRKKALIPAWMLNLPIHNLSETDMQILVEFFDARYGSNEPFEIFNGKLFPVTSVSLADGTTIDLGAKQVSSLVVKVDGVQKTLGVDYTFSAGTGTDGQDEIVFESAQTLVTAGYRGRRYFPWVKFMSDSLDVEPQPYFINGVEIYTPVIQITAREIVPLG